VLALKNDANSGYTGTIVISSCEIQVAHEIFHTRCREVNCGMLSLRALLDDTIVSFGKLVDDREANGICRENQRPQVMTSDAGMDF